ncbi:hypothetical protein AVEN_121444-1 [Araneus ventricosus]|uniref:Uncharacterized protein n=1 Tax=Araneus ventricosus TaxID=182803 RepID=A0A4Y2DN01_ARAVE|nr:hypothetical protein AVEN_121444-1 [Araneus ventricosus]
MRISKIFTVSLHLHRIFFFCLTFLRLNCSTPASFLEILRIVFTSRIPRDCQRGVSGSGHIDEYATPVLSRVHQMKDSGLESLGIERKLHSVAKEKSVTATGFYGKSIPKLYFDCFVKLAIKKLSRRGI